KLVDDDNFLVVQLLCKRRADSRTAHLLGHVLRVAARRGAERDATAPPVGGLHAALARAAGALLAEQLLRRAVYFRARLHFVRAQVSVRILAQQCLVHQRLADWSLKNGRRQLNFADLLTA